MRIIQAIFKKIGVGGKQNACKLKEPPRILEKLPRKCPPSLLSHASKQHPSVVQQLYAPKNKMRQHKLNQYMFTQANQACDTRK